MYSKRDSTDWDSSLLKSALSEFWDSIENPSSKDISGMSLCKTPGYANNNLWLNLIKIDSKILKKDINIIINDLAKNNIESRPVWHPNHLQKPVSYTHLTLPTNREV